MANTPREDASYIVMGVKKHDNGEYELIGLTSHADDAMLQTQVANRISPCPEFSYEAVSYEGKSYGLLEIPVRTTGPYLAIKDFGEKLQMQKIYFRRGSKNDIATSSTEVSQICTWMANVPGISSSNLDAWDDFLRLVNYFDATTKYVLVSSSVDKPIQHLSAIGKIPWSMVIDFDPASDTTGLLSQVRETIEERRSLHQLVAGDRLPVSSDKALYWFYARGLNGRDTTLQLGRFIDWTKVYRREITHHLEGLAAATNPSPVVCLVLCLDDGLLSHLRSVLETIVSSFGDYAQIVIVSESPGTFAQISAEVGAELISIPLSELCSGLDLQFSERGDLGEDCILPTGSGTPVAIEQKDYFWLEEQMEIIHLNVGIKPDQSRTLGQDFLRGAEISWHELGNHWDVDRDLEQKVSRRLTTELEKKRTVRVNLYHAPGGGGTTLARRLLWKYHNEYPCAVLTDCTPHLTVERLYKLSSVTGGRPILLLIDGSQIEERQIDELYSLLKSRSIPVIMLQVLRRFTPQEERDRSFYLQSELSSREAYLLAEKLILVKPEKKADIEKLRDSKGGKSRTAFYFGLNAFEKDFIGLTSYVTNKLATLSEFQTRLITFLSMAHHYSQRPIRSQAFAESLGIPQNRTVRLLRSLPESSHDLIVESYDEAWRTAHDLIATEIMEQAMSSGSSDSRIWKQNLSKWGIDFAGFCRGDDLVVSEEMLEIVRRTFIYRDNADVLGTEKSGTQSFAQLLDDIPSDEGRLGVLKRLVELYPGEAHFWSHLGRFFSNRMQNFPEAIACAEKAIALSVEDSVLHHMYGMILRQKIYSLIEQRKDLSDIVPVMKDATVLFEKSRILDSDDEYGYISDVEMITRVLDYAGRDYPNGVLGYLASPKADVFLRESIQRAEDLLEQVRRQREGEGSSTYEMNSRGKLNKLYGHHDQALQIWNNLLSRKDTYHPPLRRQIVWTYLARRDRAWNKLEPKEVRKIIDLISENIIEDPTNEKDLRLWVQGIRYLENPPSIESAIERLTYWRTNSESLDSVFYLYVFYTLLAMEGSQIASTQAKRFIDESKQLSKFRRNRQKSIEWFGDGTGLRQLVHQSEMGEWDRKGDFWESTPRLVRLQGRIEKIEGPQSGRIAVAGGLQAFFVPSRSNHNAGRSENALVDFYLGFAYDGLRAWEVRDVVS